MKKIVYSLVVSIIISAVVSYFSYKYEIENCVGCGLAPDGITNLGPNFLVYNTSVFILSTIPTFTVVYVVLLIVSRFKKI